MTQQTNIDRDGDWFPLSAAQHARWFLYQYAPENRGLHNNVFSVALHGDVRPGRLSDALDRLATRHPMLRARFRVGPDGVPQQRIEALAKIPLVVTDASSLDDAVLHARASADALSTFDADAEPLVRGFLYRRGESNAVFLLIFDHLICDGWSYWVMMEELSALLSGDDARLPEIASDGAAYRDYVEWQREWLKSPRAERQFAHWERVLGREPGQLALPLDRPRPAAPSGRQCSHALEFPADLVDGVRALAQDNGGTSYGVLLLAYQSLLHRWCGQDDIVVGSAMPARGDARWSRVVGDFVNMVALRADFAADPSVADALRDTRNTAMRALRYQDYPFSLLVERLLPGQIGAEHPFFQSVFVFQNARSAGELRGLWSQAPLGTPVAQWGDLVLSRFEVAQKVAADRIPLSLQAIEREDGIRCDFQYDPDVLDAATIARMADAFRVLLRGMIADPACAISRLPLLDDAARREVLDTFNDTTLAYARDDLLHRAFERQAAAHPDAIAARDGSNAVSYRALNRRANRIAQRLIALGVRPDDRVAISATRGIPMLAGILGVLKAGGAYVPLDPKYPADRLAHMLDDSAPKAMLTESMLPAMPRAAALPTLLLDAAAFIEDAPGDDVDPRPSSLCAGHLAYVIYTSGSTGLPKGVAIEHRNAVNFIAWALASFDASELAETLFATSINFDLAVYEIFAPLSSGATLVLAADVLATDPASAVTLINTVPSGIRALLSIDGVPRGVRTINLAGEPLKRALAERIFVETRIDSLANLYGPTETTTYSTWVRMSRESGFVSHIGKPVANTRVYLLDRHGEPVPVGVVGELFIGGDGVARGYLHRPELTAERFLADPFSSQPGARMYRTGDLGRWLADGSIEYLGRNDFQVKIRGFRIELGEIEARLGACEGVRDAVVVARDGANGDKRLVAYAVPEPGMRIAIADLREALARTLADYMIPGAFVVLETLPLTPNGKLDRKALPDPGEDAVVSRDYAAPANDTERAIVAIWQELLGLARIGRNDHFFELGGNSLIALQLVSRLRRTLGVELALRELFARPTIAALAEVLVATPANAALDTMSRIPLVDRDGPLPLSWAQQRLWFLDQLDQAAGAAYHMPAALHLRGDLDRAALRATLDRIVARHESLRTRILDVRGEPAQTFAPADIGFALVEEDLSGLDPAMRSVAVARIGAEEATERFDLSCGPLIRGRLLRLAADEHVLLVTQHHIVSDGWSVGVLVREMSALYDAFATGRADPLPPLSAQYADYAVWQRDLQRGDVLERQLGFWRRHLEGAPMLLELPTDRPRPPVQSYAGACHAVVIPSALTRSLDALAQRHGATLFMVLLAGWSTLLSKLGGQGDIVVGTPVANRLRQDLEPMIGLFVNTLAIRTRIASSDTVSALLAAVRDAVLDAFEHQALPFEQVVDAVQPVRSLGHSPLCQTLLTMDNTPHGDALRLHGLTVERMPSAQDSTRYDLSLSLRRDGEGLVGEIEYATDLFDPSTIARWFDHFLILLDAMTADDAARVGTLPLMSAQERVRMVEGFNAVVASPPAERRLHRLFEDAVARDPRAPALIDGDLVLDYGELNARANRIAHRLIALGVAPDERVALCVERGAAMVVAMLGILKAGGAYVPLDPAYPVERLAYMLRDSRPKALVTATRSDATADVRAAAQAQALPLVALDDAGLDDAGLEGDAVEGGSAAGFDANPDADAMGLRADHLAQLIYTSGSTGQPKGVMVEHDNVAHLVANHIANCGLAPGQRMLQFASYSFDSSVVEIFPTLAAGATLVLRPAHLLAPDQAFVDMLDRHAVSIVDLPTAFFHVWAQEVAAGRAPPPPAALRMVVVGGEALESRHLQAWLSAEGARDRAVLNTYGPTEAAVYATAVRFDAANPSDGATPSIGAPVPNARVYLLDADGMPVPQGVAGELCIAGPQVARGYFDRPELSAERFCRDPFHAGDARMYRTGDLGRWRADGSIEFVGRNDFQVKIRGFRIELGEIEAALARCADVRDAVVIAREHAPGDRRLVAYVVMAPGVELSPAALRDALAGDLAEFMLPSTFVALDALPLTPNGKIDRRALPVPESGADQLRAYVQPEGEYEVRLAGIWAELLGLDRVGRDDRFFEVGGNSLVITRLGFAVKEAFGVTANVGDLYGLHSLRDMAAFVQAQCERRAAAAETIVEFDL